MIIWVEFVVGFLLCSDRISPGTPVSPFPQKPTFTNSNSILGSISSRLESPVVDSPHNWARNAGS